MKRWLFLLVNLMLFLSVSTSSFAQVKLFDSGVTKFYPEGNRITYFQMSGFPNTEEMREYVKKSVLENPDIDRVVIYTDGKTFMYDALQSIEPDMVVDAINDALTKFNYEISGKDKPDSSAKGDFKKTDTDKPGKNLEKQNTKKNNKQ